MPKKITVVLLFTLCTLCENCNRNNFDQYNDIEKIFHELKKTHKADYIDLPPRMIKAFLRVEKANENLIQVVSQSEQFMIMHLDKSESRKVYKKAKYDIKKFIEVNHFKESATTTYNSVNFELYTILSSEDELKNLLIIIDEDNLLSVIYMKGIYSTESIEGVNSHVSPKEILELNQKFTNKI